MRWVLIVAALMTGFVPRTAQSAQPRTISYQGSLMDGSGLVSPDGNYVMSFRLWDAASGGLLLWQEVDTVSVASGLFNATLGKNSPFTQTFANPYWLGITVGTNPELTPRVKLSSSPYAIHAVTADSLTGGLPAVIGCSAVAQAVLVPTGFGPLTFVSFLSEQWDTNSFHENVIHPERLTVPVTGVYQITAYADWDANGSGRRDIDLLRNGSFGVGPLALSSSQCPASGGDIQLNLSWVGRLNAGEFIGLKASQDSGASRTIDWAQISMVYLGK